MQHPKIRKRIENAMLGSFKTVDQFRAMMKALDKRIEEINAGPMDEELEKELEWCVQSYAVGTRTILSSDEKLQPFVLQCWKKVSKLDTMDDV